MAEQRFKILTRELMPAPTDAANPRLITGVASSTIIDLEGDRMSERALESMRKSAVERMTIFTDHTYKVPDNLLGTVVAARVQRSPDGQYADLIFDIEVFDASINPKAEQVLNAVRKGAKLGLSIGAVVTEYHEEKQAAADGKQHSVTVFDDVLLLETSIVGIPCNPRSWVTNALKSLKGLPQDDDDFSAKDGDPKASQQARSAHYHIGIKEGGNVTKPTEWANVPDSEWGDPVNYRYPMPDKTHADNAASRWGDESNRSQYTSEEQSIIGGRIQRRQSAFGERSEPEQGKAAPVETTKGEDGDNSGEYGAPACDCCDACGPDCNGSCCEECKHMDPENTKDGEAVAEETPAIPAETQFSQAEADRLAADYLKSSEPVAETVEAEAETEPVLTLDEWSSELLGILLGEDGFVAEGDTLTLKAAPPMRDDHHRRLIQAHNHIAKALGANCQMGMGQADDDDPDHDNDYHGSAEDLGLTAKALDAQADTAALAQQLAAAKALVADYTEELRAIKETRTVLEAEIEDLEARKQALLTQATTRPTQLRGQRPDGTLNPVAVPTLDYATIMERELAEFERRGALIPGWTYPAE